MPKQDERPTDYRQMRRDHDRSNLLMTLFVLVVIGGVLVAIIIKPVALLAALPFLFLGAIGILALYGLWLLIEKLTRR
jgi:hypothetical protein